MLASRAWESRWKNYVYHLPLAEHFNNLDIVQLEMVNILLDWHHKKILVRCDNNAIVKVLTSGRAQDPYLSACARNIWAIAALYGLDVSYFHVMGKINDVAHLLSRRSFTEDNYVKLAPYV